MSVQEINMRINDYQLEILKYLVIDIIVIIGTLKMADIIQFLNIASLNAFAVAAVLLICTVIATFDRIDNYCLLKEEKKRVEIELEEEKTA